MKAPSEVIRVIICPLEKNGGEEPSKWGPHPSLSHLYQRPFRVLMLGCSWWTHATSLKPEMLFRTMRPLTALIQNRHQNHANPIKSKQPWCKITKKGLKRRYPPKALMWTQNGACYCQNTIWGPGLAPDMADPVQKQLGQQVRVEFTHTTPLFCI